MQPVWGQRCGDPGLVQGGTSTHGVHSPVDLLILRVLSVIHSAQWQHYHTFLGGVLEDLGDGYG